jgi:iron-sulfur cluster insertion protein
MSDLLAMHPRAPQPAIAQKPAAQEPAVQMNYQQLDAPLVFTSAAARKVAELIREEGNAALKLRVYISGGGCSGFQYGFSFDEEQAEDDLAVQKDGVTLLVDPLSLQYLLGAEVDYSESLHGAQFSIRNPNAKTTCGCGSSFSA